MNRKDKIVSADDFASAHDRDTRVLSTISQRRRPTMADITS